MRSIYNPLLVFWGGVLGGGWYFVLVVRPTKPPLVVGSQEITLAQQQIAMHVGEWFADGIG